MKILQQGCRTGAPNDFMLRQMVERFGFNKKIGQVARQTVEDLVLVRRLGRLR
ncbi:hypothetical protein DsansV1_C15g0136771 [Dioscorea sansibarensis]